MNSTEIIVNPPSSFFMDTTEDISTSNSLNDTDIFKFFLNDELTSPITDDSLELMDSPDFSEDSSEATPPQLTPESSDDFTTTIR